jgi:hypothetical protein
MKVMPDSCCHLPVAKTTHTGTVSLIPVGKNTFRRLQVYVTRSVWEKMAKNAVDIASSPKSEDPGSNPARV